MHKRKFEIIKYDFRSMLFKNKKGKLTCETNPSEKPSIKNKHLIKTKEQP